jgi:hypothetical protein
MPGLFVRSLVVGKTAGLSLVLLLGSTLRPTAIPEEAIRRQPPVSPGYRVKSPLEIRLEQIIDAAYRRYFKLCDFGGHPLVLRIPFGQSGERRGGRGYHQSIFRGGKEEPEAIWKRIDTLLQGEDFADYLLRLRLPGEKLVVFDLEQRRFSVYTDAGLIAIMKEGPYPGTRTRVFVLKIDGEIRGADIYNYLYCVGSVGLDCSGFVYNIEKDMARAFGLDLDQELAQVFGVPSAQLPQILGLWFFDPSRSHSERVEDRVQDLRPGDVFLFRGRLPDGGLGIRHSAVVQSVDLKRGVIRYLQCTDWAPQEERGVHESFIRFDPSKANISLKDPSLEWSQEVHPTFAGETSLRYWQNDGHRYRSYLEAGGSLIVRLKCIKALVEEAEPLFYQDVYQAGP